MPHRALRRSAATAAAAALALVGMTACGSSSSGKTTLTVWTYYTGAQQIAALKAQDALFEKTHPNVEIKQVQVAGTEMDPKLLAGVSTKSGPDIVLNNVVVDFPELTSAGVLSNLTSDWDAYPDKSQYPAAAVWKTTKGQIYNVMSYSNLLGLYYNKTILDQYHLTPPTTLSQFVSDMAVVAKAGKYSPLAASASPDTGGAWTFFPLLLENGTNYCNITTSAATSAFQTVKNWVSAGYLPKESATETQTTSWTAFMSGKYAFGINGNWNLGDAKTATFAWGTTQFPAGADGSHVFPGGEGLGIGAFSKHKALDWQYLEDSWLSQKGNVVDFTTSGQIPDRADVAETSAVKSDTAATPFVEATKTVSAWPNNPKTADMQTYFGTELSAVVSGQTSPASAGAATVARIQSDIKAGGGGC